MLIWPVPGSHRITSPFGNRKAPTAGASTMHGGIDIGGEGLEIVASKSGVVEEHNPNSSSAGNMLWIRHSDGSMTKYLHMVSGSNTVTKGDRVLASQVIGRVGDTGNVTGPHLHFEYLPDGSNPVDPMPYFGDSGLLPAETSNDIASESYTENKVPYNPDSITPITSSEFLHGRPMYAYFKLFIGELELMYTHRKPNHNQYFEINRLEDAGCTAQFHLFDDNWDEIETYLADNWMNVYIQYGYAEGVRSPKYKLLLRNYSIDFRDTGTLMSIDAISEGIYQNLDKVVELDTGTKNPGEAIRAICEYKGWTIDESDFAVTDTIEDREENYILRDDYAITYIKEVIIPEALSSDEILTFYVDADEAQTAHLKVIKYGVSNSAERDVRTYIYQKGYDSVVKSLSFDIKGIFGGTSNISVATGLEGTVFGTLDKEEYSSEEDQSSVLTTATGLYSHTMARQSIPRFTTSGESPTQLKNKLFYYVKNSTTEQYEATMVIIGDPDIQLLEDIRIINMTEFGIPHHTSGIYLVKGIVDTVEGGEFYTTLKLQRNGDINEGVELRNPRHLIK